jgi:transitional endoplasmic reticulum ATPase
MDGTLTKAHFDEAMSTARKSVSKTELARYLKFKKELSGGGGLKQAAAAVEAAEGASAASAPTASGEDDEELYD